MYSKVGLAQFITLLVILNKTHARATAPKAAACGNGTFYSDIVHDYLPCDECARTTYSNCGICCQGEFCTPAGFFLILYLQF